MKFRMLGNSILSFLGLLQLLFVGLKFAGKINWSWWWIMSPLWGSVALVLISMIGAIAIFSILIAAVGKDLK